MLIRFGILKDWAPPAPDNISDSLVWLAAIPASLAARWTEIRMQNAGTCHFADGHNATVTELDGAVTYSAGGNDPNAHFKLIIDGRYVYDKLIFYRGYGSSAYDRSAIEYTGKSLLECNPREQSNYERVNVKSDPICYDASNRLLPGYKFLSTDELIELDQDNLKIKLAGTLSLFCRTLPSLSDDVARLHDSGNEDDIDIDNDGKSDRVFYYRNDLGQYEDYGYLVAFTGNLSRVDEFSKKFEGQTYPDSGQLGEAATQAGGDVIKIAVQNEIFKYNGKEYIYSLDPYPDRVPSAIVSELLPDHSIKQVCAFP